MSDTGKSTITSITTTTKSLSNTHIYLLITFVVSLIIVIINGRILNEINLSKSKSDPKIQSAHKWAAWTVGIFSTIALISIVAFVVLFFIKKK